MGITGKFFFSGQEIHSVNIFGSFPEPVNSVYEVLRVIESKPLFLADHYQRLDNSCRNFKFKILSEKELKNIIKLIIEENNITDGNLRIEYRFFDSSPQLTVYFIPYCYPTTEMVSNGVDLVSYGIERPNPHVKQAVINDKIRNTVADILADKKIFEVVLVNSKHEITEGSRSNIFFIKGEKVYSPPASLILEGITRKKVIEICRKEDILYLEDKIKFLALTDFDACFLTGTSPKVLPVAKINEVTFHVKHPLINNLINSYDTLISEYLKQFYW